MSGKRATRKSSGPSKPAIPPPPSPTSSHKSIGGSGGEGTATPAHPKPLRNTRGTIRQTELTKELDPTAEQEPRRSVRATKGQHTKAFESLENGPQPSKRKQAAAAKKGKKAAEKEKEDEEEDEEIIRCVCGATTQEADEQNEPWIACEQCGAWQHNVCMGMSIFEDELPKEYFCEQCKPQDHKELMDSIDKGETLWLTRRQKYEDENKKKKGKKGKGKRVSDPKDRSSPATSTTKAAAKASPAPEIKKEDESAAKTKRKSRDHSQGPHNKMRKVSETRAVPVPALPKYTPPADLAESIDKLEGTRKNSAEGLRKSLDAALDMAVKSRLFTIPQGSTKKTLAERHAIEIERALHDTHPNAAAAKSQLRTLMFNLKKNVELAARVLNRTLTAPALAGMSSDEMATEELQRETAEMKAKADKQATLIAEDGPRMRRTHKGEEIVEDDNVATTTEEVPSNLRRQSVRDTATTEAGSPTEHEHDHVHDHADSQVELPANIGSGPLRIDTEAKHSPRQGDFDINKVFSSVKSPSATHQRRPSGPAPSAGPGYDPDVDRMLQDGNDSPPYSPTENLDPDVVWQGHLMMTNLADITTVAKYAGGADLSKVKGISWKDLIPPLLTVAGRIPEEKAVPYLCGLRYNNQIDLVVTSLSPANNSDASARSQFLAVVNYFDSKKRYGVIGERKLGNVRDTYLVPVPAGNGPLPEILENIEDHLIPRNRPDPTLLMVFVVRDENIPLQTQATPTPSSAQTATPAPDRKQSLAAPTWSPATPQGAFHNTGYPAPHQSHTPIPPPVIPGQPTPSVPQRQTFAANPAPAAPQSEDTTALRQAQLEGERMAREVLGELFASSTITFLLPHASRMKEGEWKAVKRCMERDPRSREDLPLLSKLLTEEGNNARHNGQNGGQPPPSAAPPSSLGQTTVADGTANLPPRVPQPAQPRV